MPRPSDSVDIRLISKVSLLYYHHELTQQEIADRLILSRPKVSRLLKQARKQGLIQVSVSVPSGNFVDLELRLERKFQLKEALIVETGVPVPGRDNRALKQQLGIAASRYLHRTISDGDTIGVTWGTTLQAMIEAMQPKPSRDVHVVQTLGGVGPPEARAHAMDISRRLSQLLDCRLTLLPAPGIVDHVEARQVLLSDRRVKAAIELFDKINTLYVGIGALRTNPVLRAGSHEISEELLKEILKSYAVGDIGLNFFKADGEKAETVIHDLVIGMSFDILKNIETVVGIAGGKEKFEPILGALKGELIDVLITDQQTAEKLIMIEE